MDLEVILHEIQEKKRSVVSRIRLQSTLSRIICISPQDSSETTYTSPLAICPSWKTIFAFAAFLHEKRAQETSQREPESAKVKRRSDDDEALICLLLLNKLVLLAFEHAEVQQSLPTSVR